MPARAAVPVYGRAILTLSVTTFVAPVAVARTRIV